MRQASHSLAAILISLLLGFVLCGAIHPAAAQPADELVARGKSLVLAGNCGGCHTADPAKPLAGGKRIETRFGTFYTPNLTPDLETGLRSWRDDQFMRALREGVAPDGSRYYPAFPYPYFTRLVRDDILAIRAYLATLDPVHNKEQPPALRFPFNFRIVMRLWNWLYLQPGILMPDQAKGVEWNRGRYLVEGLGNCGRCHAPKGWLGGDKGPPAFASWVGNSGPDQIADYLRGGRHAGGEAGPVMREIINDSTSKMSDRDRRSIGVYMKSLASP